MGDCVGGVLCFDALCFSNHQRPGSPNNSSRNNSTESLKVGTQTLMMQREDYYRLMKQNPFWTCMIINIKITYLCFPGPSSYIWVTICTPCWISRRSEYSWGLEFLQCTCNIFIVTFVPNCHPEAACYFPVLRLAWSQPCTPSLLSALFFH